MINNLQSSQTIQQIEYEISSLSEVTDELQAFNLNTLKVSIQALESTPLDCMPVTSFVPNNHCTSPLIGS